MISSIQYLLIYFYFIVGTIQCRNLAENELNRGKNGNLIFAHVVNKNSNHLK